jgi:hypothetical protein
MDTMDTPAPSAAPSQPAPSVTTPSATTPSPAWRALLAAPLALAAVVGLVLVAFGLPAVTAEPHDVPIGVAGPPAVAREVAASLEQRQPGALAVTAYPDEAALEDAIRNRQVYGGVALGAQGPTVLTASAGSVAVAQALNALGAGLAQQQGAPVPTRDVVALPADDPRGAGLAAALLPVVLGAVLPAVALGHLTRRRGLQVGGALVYSAVAGLAFAAVLHPLFGSLAGDYLAESAVLGATIGAGTLALLGLQWVAGRVGLALGAVTLLLVGNPLSGASTAPEFLATPWREIGQAMPPGAGSQLLRSVSFFDGAGSLTPWVVLAGWAAVGLLLLILPVGRRAPRPTAA